MNELVIFYGMKEHFGYAAKSERKGVKLENGDIICLCCGERVKKEEATILKKELWWAEVEAITGWLSILRDKENAETEI